MLLSTKFKSAAVAVGELTAQKWRTCISTTHFNVFLESELYCKTHKSIEWDLHTYDVWAFEWLDEHVHVFSEVSK